MPGPTSESYEAPDGPKPLMPPWHCTDGDGITSHDYIQKFTPEGVKWVCRRCGKEID